MELEHWAAENHPAAVAVRSLWNAFSPFAGLTQPATCWEYPDQHVRFTELGSAAVAGLFMVGWLSFS